MAVCYLRSVSSGIALAGGISVTEWQQQQRGAAMPGQAAGQTWQRAQPHAQPYAQPQYGQSQYGHQQHGQPQYQQVQPYEPRQPAAGAQGQRRTGLTGAQQFWYVLQCIAFGAGYFAKLPTAKALSEMPQFRTAGY
jgi:hypothetical protein